jgi:hypothetical protein
MYKPTLTLAAGLLLATSIGAGASVVYHWQPVHNTEHLYTTGGTLEITDQAWRSGHVHAHWGPNGENNLAWPGDSIKVLSLGITSRDGVSDGTGLWPGISFVDHDFDPPFKYYAGRFDADFYFDPHESTVDGSMDILSFESRVVMGERNDGLWHISHFGSDYATPWDDGVVDEADSSDDIICPPKGYGYASNCYYAGATGYWSLDPSTIPTPEPGTLALFGLSVGLLGLGVTRRRKHGVPVA